MEHEKKKRKHAWMSRKTTIFAPQLRTNVRQFAQMAESVDALVSNTSGFTSIPVRPRVWVQRKAVDQMIDSLFLFNKQPISKTLHTYIFSSTQAKNDLCARFHVHPLWFIVRGVHIKKHGQTQRICPISQSLHNTCR